MENPILEFRKSKGWTRSELSRRTGVSCQVLRDMETGFVKRISTKTIESLNHVGLDGNEIRKKLQEWNSVQHESRKNTLSIKEDVQKVQEIPDPDLVSKPQVKESSICPTIKPVKQLSKKHTKVDVNENDE